MEMIDDSKRREVAAKLRGNPEDTLIPHRIGRHYGMGCHEAADRFWNMCCRIREAGNYDIAFSTTSVLADLIEPEPERTCRMVSAFDTDELEGIQENISFSPEDTLAYRCEGCGFDFRYERGLYPSYCPNCGARVTGND